MFIICFFSAFIGEYLTNDARNVPEKYRTIIDENDLSIKLINAERNEKGDIIAENEEGIQVGKIYSEEELTSLSKEYDATIANGLLSRERLKRKIDDFNGYVGYVGTNHSIYYDQKVEKDKLNIIR